MVWYSIMAHPDGLNLDRIRELKADLRRVAPGAWKLIIQGLSDTNAQAPRSAKERLDLLKRIEERLYQEDKHAQEDTEHGDMSIEKALDSLKQIQPADIDPPITPDSP